jgi:hypothetical protein
MRKVAAQVGVIARVVAMVIAMAMAVRRSGPVARAVGGAGSMEWRGGLREGCG